LHYLLPTKRDSHLTETLQSATTHMSFYARTSFKNSFITGPPIHSVGGQYCFALWRLSSSVTLHGRPAGGFTRAGQAMTSFCLHLIIAPQ